VLWALKGLLNLTPLEQWDRVRGARPDLSPALISSDGATVACGDTPLLVARRVALEDARIPEDRRFRLREWITAEEQDRED
jgi:hypothetical protein